MEIDDVLEQAKKTKRLALENAKNTLVEMVTPKLKKSIEKDLNANLFEEEFMQEEDDELDLELGDDKETSDDSSDDKETSDDGDGDDLDLGGDDDGDSEEDIDVEEILKMSVDDIDDLDPEETASLLKTIVGAAEEGEIEIEDAEEEGSEDDELEMDEEGSDDDESDDEESDEDDEKDKNPFGESKRMTPKQKKAKLLEIRNKIERKKKLDEIRIRQEKRLLEAKRAKIAAKRNIAKKTQSIDQNKALRLENKILVRRNDRMKEQVKKLSEDYNDIAKFSLQYSYFLKLKNNNPYIDKLNEDKKLAIVKAFDNVNGKSLKEVEDKLKKLYSAIMEQTKKVIKKKNLKEGQNPNKRMLRDNTDTKVLQTKKTIKQKAENKFANSDLLKEMLGLAFYDADSEN